MTANLPLFWHIWIAGLVAIGLIFIATLVVRIYFSKDTHTEEVVWDETIIESAAPPPLWWFWLIICALFFSVIYMIFYPSLGNYNGLFDLTTSKRYIESRADIDNKYYKKLTILEKLSNEALQKDSNAMQLANNIFLQNCVNCHGKSANGQHSFPNLKDDDWLWGEKEEQIAQTIKHGRKSVMPPFGAVLGESGVEEVAHYVKSLSLKSKKDYPGGKEKFQQFCVACHGINAQGNQLLGAANLTDNVWLYGDDLASIKESIALGRIGDMPAQKGRLNDLQIKLLVAWLTKDNK